MPGASSSRISPRVPSAADPVPGALRRLVWHAVAVHESAPPLSAAPAAGILRHPYLLVTVGSCALVFLAAFESLAVTTIMPIVSRELDGASLYALAFAGPLATGVIGMVGAGNWSDRRGPLAPLYASVAVFVLGLLIAGTPAAWPSWSLAGWSRAWAAAP